jgi:hypothetical protein
VVKKSPPWQLFSPGRAGFGSLLFSVEGHGPQLIWRPGRLPTRRRWSYGGQAGDTADDPSLPRLRTRAVGDWFVNSPGWLQPSRWDLWRVDSTPGNEWPDDCRPALRAGKITDPEDPASHSTENGEERRFSWQPFGGQAFDPG